MKIGKDNLIVLAKGRRSALKDQVQKIADGKQCSRVRTEEGNSRNLRFAKPVQVFIPLRAAATDPPEVRSNQLCQLLRRVQVSAATDDTAAGRQWYRGGLGYPLTTIVCMGGGC